MSVFISWSGDSARDVANALMDFLRLCNHHTDPWTSDEIPPGEQWSPEILKRLKESVVGIVCVTKENRQTPWLLFEAGALAKDGALHVLRIDLTNGEVGLPLSSYQSSDATRAGIGKLLERINGRLQPEDRRRAGDLTLAADRFWPELEKAIATARESSAKVPSGKPVRADRELLEELLTISRTISARMSASAPGRPTRERGLTTIEVVAHLKRLGLVLTAEERAAVKDRVRAHNSPDDGSVRPSRGLFLSYLVNEIRSNRDRE